MVADRAEMLGLYLYDHRIWPKILHGKIASGILTVTVLLMSLNMFTFFGVQMLSSMIERLEKT